MNRVVVVGSANIDLVAACPRLPGPGETVLGDALTVVPGGKGANQAVAAARAGADCAMVAAVGDDAHGPRLLATLAQAGVDTSAVRTEPGPSGTALIAVDPAGANSIIVIPGANARLTGVDPAVFAGASIVLAQLEIPRPTVLAAFAAARAAGARTVLNAAPAAPLEPELLALVDLLVVNEPEAAAIAGTGPEHALRPLLERVPAVAVTLGERGVRYGDRSGAALDIPAPRATAVDTTAAGDTFTGALAAALAAGRPVADALRFGCAAASLAVEVAGASSSIPLRAAIDARYHDAYADSYADSYGERPQ